MSALPSTSRVLSNRVVFARVAPPRLKLLLKAAFGVSLLLGVTVIPIGTWISAWLAELEGVVPLGSLAAVSSTSLLYLLGLAAPQWLSRELRLRYGACVARDGELHHFGPFGDMRQVIRHEEIRSWKETDAGLVLELTVARNRFLRLTWPFLIPTSTPEDAAQAVAWLTNGGRERLLGVEPTTLEVEGRPWVGALAFLLMVFGPASVLAARGAATPGLLFGLTLVAVCLLVGLSAPNWRLPVRRSFRLETGALLFRWKARSANLVFLQGVCYDLVEAWGVADGYLSWRDHAQHVTTLRLGPSQEESLLPALSAQLAAEGLSPPLPLRLAKPPSRVQRAAYVAWGLATLCWVVGAGFLPRQFEVNSWHDPAGNELTILSRGDEVRFVVVGCLTARPGTSLGSSGSSQWVFPGLEPELTHPRLAGRVPLHAVWPHRSGQVSSAGAFESDGASFPRKLFTPPSSSPSLPASLDSWRAEIGPGLLLDFVTGKTSVRSHRVADSVGWSLRWHVRQGAVSDVLVYPTGEATQPGRWGSAGWGVDVQAKDGTVSRSSSPPPSFAEILEATQAIRAGGSVRETCARWLGGL